MKTVIKKTSVSPLTQRRRSLARLAGTISKARATGWIRHIKAARKEWR